MKPLFKKVVAILLSLTLFFLSGPHQVFAQEADATNLPETTVEVNTSESIQSEFETTKYSAELIAAYKKLCEYIPTISPNINISLETFAREFDTEIYPSLDKYLESYYQLFPKTSNDTSRGPTSYWYYNTDGCTAMPNYSKYNLLSIVQPGDILFENVGGFNIQRHVAIVEGIYYDSYYGVFYIRLFEAIGYEGVLNDVGDANGVCRSVLDDDRFDTNEGKILRVSGATSSQINGAINFCRNQIGDDYLMDLGKEFDSSTQHWYSSELIWAAYYNQGIDLETNNSALGIMPIEILNSSRTVEQRVTANLGAPNITSITFSNQTSVNIYWSSPNAATSYFVYRATGSPTSNITLLATTANNYYFDFTLSSSKTYYYWIVANHSGTPSNRSSVKAIQTSFAQVSTSWCRATSNGSIEFSWPQVYNAEKYEVYRSAGSSSNFVKITTIYSTTFSESGLIPGTEYYYKVYPVSSNGTTATTSTYIRITPGVMRKPKIYLVFNQEYTSILLKWTKIPEATSYDVYYSVNNSETYIKFTNTEYTYCHYMYPEYEGTWYFRVVPVNSQGEGQWSNSVSYTVTFED